MPFECQIIGEGGTVGAIRGKEVPEVEYFLRLHGINPSDVNKVVWPHGASRPATATMLVDYSQYVAVAGGEGAQQVEPFTVRIGDVTAVGMWASENAPTIISTSQGVLCLVKLMDARAWWVQRPFADGVNIRSRDKRLVTGFYRESMKDGMAPWKLKDLLIELMGAGEARLINAEPGTSPFLPSLDDIDFSDVDSAGTSLDDLLVDIRWGDDTHAEVLDRVLAMTGFVLVVYPSGQPFRYAVKRVALGMVRMLESPAIVTVRDNVLTGRLYALPTPGPNPTHLASVQSLLNNLPVNTRVTFPSALKDTTTPYTPDDPLSKAAAWGGGLTTYGVDVTFDTAYQSQVWDGVSLSLLKSFMFTSTKRTLSCPYWALVNGDNQPEANDALKLDQIAVQVAKIYYGRATAVTGEVVLLGCRDFGEHVWPGALYREWSIAEMHDKPWPITRVRGSMADSLFGYQERAPRIHAAEGAKAVVHPDGSVSIHSVSGSSVDPGKWFRITSALLVKPNTWKYAFNEVQLSSAGDIVWVPVEGGETSDVEGDAYGNPAYNGIEAGNDGIGREGAGMSVVPGPTAVVTVLPIGGPGGSQTSPVVRGYRTNLVGEDGTESVVWAFSANNDVDVDCVDAPETQGAQQLIASELVPDATLKMKSGTAYLVYLGFVAPTFRWDRMSVSVRTAGAGIASMEFALLKSDEPWNPDLDSMNLKVLAATTDVDLPTSTGTKRNGSDIGELIRGGIHLWAGIRVEKQSSGTMPTVYAVTGDVASRYILTMDDAPPLSNGAVIVAAPPATAVAPALVTGVRL